MTYQAVVPWRAAAGKTRLSQHLSVPQRHSLSRAMLLDVVTTLTHTCQRVTVGASDADAAAQARDAIAAKCLRRVEVATIGTHLDTAVAKALRATSGAAGILVVAADLPYLSPRALDEFAVFAPHAAVVIARSYNGGTNGLLFRNGARIDTAFGPESAAIHAQRAASAGLVAAVVDMPCLANDVDEPSDVDLLIRRVRLGDEPTQAEPRVGQHTRAAIAQLGL
ncbi:MAG: 2-phospho-L-lactate guanylyltransferase [Nitriliruptoraceae bacterium]